MSGDNRFNSMHNSATFKSSKKDNFKVKVDDRFKTLLSDERFQSVPGQVDRYGRKTKSKDSANKVAKEMREFYDIDEGEEAAPEQTKKGSKPAAKPNGGMDRLDYLNKLARGEISDEDSSDSDSSDGSESDSGSDSDESSGSDEDNTTRKKNGTSYNDPSYKGALQVPGQEEQELVDDVVSTRIAIQNSDWENVSAEDLMVVLQSFCPAGGTSAVRKVTVYVSDFGKKRMELESRYGPQGIWKVQAEDDEDENNEDLYDQIVGVDEEEEEMEMEEEEEEEEQSGSESDASGSSHGDSESEQEPAPKGKSNAAGNKAPISRKAAKAAKKGDFLRKNGAVGLVMHHDLKLRGVSSKYRSEESEDEQSGSQSGSDGNSEDESASGSDEGSDIGDEDQDEENPRRKKSAQSKKAAKKQLKDGEGFDEVALRKYELSKLRYYFAVAECDSARTANMLYEELDGVEMESSAMVFDLSLVPEELSFEGREVRDSYSASASGAVNPNYKPPDFVVNALQHTKVQCSWDEGEKLRDRQLSNFSTWRNLNESELQQYVADSDSSDEEEEDEEDSEPEAKKNGKNKKISKKKQSKAALMRKMLLGGGSDESEADDFFAEEAGSDSDQSGAGSGSEEEQDSMYGDDDVPEGFSRDDIGSEDDEEEEDGEGKSMTYMPDLGKDILARKRGTEETPYEAEQRKMAEKKKARKVAKKAYQEAQEAEKKAAALGQAGKKTKGGKAAAPVVLTEEERRKQAALELLFDEDAKDDYDMREVVKAEKDKARGKKSNKRKKAKLDGETATEDNFKIDTKDDRFSKLFEGDSRFGIDKTSTEFRPTPAVQTILSEQTKRRAQKEKNESDAPASSKPASKTEESAGVDVNNLVNKLKRKYAKA